MGLLAELGRSLLESFADQLKSSTGLDFTKEVYHRTQQSRKKEEINERLEYLIYHRDEVVRKIISSGDFDEEIATDSDYPNKLVDRWIEEYRDELNEHRQNMRYDAEDTMADLLGMYRDEDGKYHVDRDDEGNRYSGLSDKAYDAARRMYSKATDAQLRGVDEEKLSSEQLEAYYEECDKRGIYY